ncbi:MAG: hypothetical protein QE273_02490 [Verrucomicrobiales bacterium]|nr:hypothetical protein [Verrucomicrobiales bacterium]
MKSALIILSTIVLAAGISLAAKPYPLKTCLVTDNELGSMGKVITKVYDGQEIKFCCKPCVGKFEKNQAKYLSKLN